MNCGLYYFANKSNVIRETVRLQAVPLINAYVGTVALTFHYIPFYGKFAFFTSSSVPGMTTTTMK